LKDFSNNQELGTEAIHYLAQIQYTQTSNGANVSSARVITNALHQIYMINLRRFFCKFIPIIERFYLGQRENNVKWPTPAQKSNDEEENRSNLPLYIAELLFREMTWQDLCSEDQMIHSLALETIREEREASIFIDND
jgi:hypothetical protein